MFNFFKKKGTTNVVPFPEPKSVPSMPKVEPPNEEKKPATVFYRIGFTDDNRIALQIGYSEIMMNRVGVENLISQLSVFRDQLKYEDEDEGNC